MTPHTSEHPMPLITPPVPNAQEAARPYREAHSVTLALLIAITLVKPVFVQRVLSPPVKRPFCLNRFRGIDFLTLQSTMHMACALEFGCGEIIFKDLLC